METIGKYEIEYIRDRYGPSDLIRIIVYEFAKDDKPLNNGLPVGDFYIDSNYKFAEEEISKLINFPKHTIFTKDFVVKKKGVL